VNIHKAQRIFLFIWKAAALGINNRVNETLGITAELNITSQVTYFIKQILSLLEYEGRSIVATLNLSPFQRMVGFEVEISASMGGYSINFDAQCRPFAMTRHPKSESLCLTPFPE
jgi:hypothetical protein